MSLSQSFQQKLLQKLSPQQIQLMKLLQVPTANLEERIQSELEENPALEMAEGEKEIEFGEAVLALITKATSKATTKEKEALDKAVNEAKESQVKKPVTDKDLDEIKTENVNIDTKDTPVSIKTSEPVKKSDSRGDNEWQSFLKKHTKSLQAIAADPKKTKRFETWLDKWSEGVEEGDGRKKGIHGKGHPMRKKQQAAIHAGESVESIKDMLYRKLNSK